MAQSTLKEFRTALEAGDVESATELASPVLDALEARRKRITALKPAAQQLLTTSESDDNQNIGRQFVIQADEAEQKRLELSLVIVQFIQGGAEPTAVVEIVDRVINKQSSVDSSEEQLRDKITKIGLDPILVVTGPDQLQIPKGIEGSATLTVENVGGQPTDTVSVEAETDLSGVSVSPSSIDPLDPSEDIKVNLSVSESDTDGGFMVNVVARGLEGGATGSLTLTAIIAAKEDYVERALTQLDEFESRVDRVEEQTRGEKSRAVKKAIQDIRQRLEALEGDLEDNEVTAEEANRRLDEIVNRLHSLRSELKGWEEVSDAIQASLRSDVAEIITTLETAKEAAL